jgi:Flp pilus assembly protein TadD
MNLPDQDILCDQFNTIQELGDCHASVGNYHQASRHYERAAALEPDEPGPYVGLGVIALQNNLLDDAEIAFRVACRLDPTSSRAYAGLAMVAQRMGRTKEAFDGYLKSLERDTNNLTALLGLFQTSCQMGSFAEVIHYLKIYLRMHPDDTAVMFTLAALYMRDGGLEQAKQLLLQVVQLDPDNKDAANVLEEVEHTLNRSIHEPMDSSLLFNIATESLSNA